MCVYSIQGHFKFKSLKLRRTSLVDVRLSHFPPKTKTAVCWILSRYDWQQILRPLQIQITKFYISTSLPSHRKLELKCLHINTPLVCQCKFPVSRFAHRCGLGSIICTSDFSEEDRILVYVTSRTGREQTSACSRLWALSRSGNCCALMPMFTRVCRRVVQSKGENGLYVG